MRLKKIHRVARVSSLRSLSEIHYRLLSAGAMLPPQAAIAIATTVVAFAAWLVRRPKRDPALARRAAAAMELLAVLGQHGATHVPLQVRQVKYAPTLGIFTAAPGAAALPIHSSSDCESRCQSSSSMAGGRLAARSVTRM